MKRIIKFPPELKKPSEILQIGIDTTDLSKESKCVLDFTEVRYAEPLPLMMIADQLSVLRHKFPNVEYRCLSKPGKFRGYADHIGFFRFLNFRRGNRPNGSTGSRRYIPITLFDTETLKKASGDDPFTTPYVNIIEEKSAELATVLTQLDSGNVSAMFIRYCLREAMRNVLEHSFATKMAVFAQHYPNSQKTDIVIMDNGVGVRKTLADSGCKDLHSDIDAIRLALEPGITSVSDYERSLQPLETQNTGFGLYVTSQFCSRHGIFRILSGNAAITLFQNGETQHNSRFSGTCIHISFDTSHIEDAEAELKGIIAMGEKQSDSRSGASTASKSFSINTI